MNFSEYLLLSFLCADVPHAKQLLHLRKAELKDFFQLAAYEHIYGEVAQWPQRSLVMYEVCHLHTTFDLAEMVLVVP